MPFAGCSPGEIAATLIGSSAATCSLREEAVLAAQWPLRALVKGEPGVGKRLLAKLIHRHSVRGNAKFLTVRCASASEDALGAQLFGDPRSDFGGGVFARADGGTLLLEDIDTLSPRLQARLKRFVTDDDLQHSRSRSGRRIDVRIISSTTIPLTGNTPALFSTDLYYLLNPIYLEIRPLRERPEDVQPLLEYFTSYYARRSGVATPELTEECLALCRAYAWPGNLRQLQAAAAMFVGDVAKEPRPVVDDAAFVRWSVRTPEHQPETSIPIAAAP